ncbi:hypothetical protein ES702_03186 [subsurface metagenome]
MGHSRLAGKRARRRAERSDMIEVVAAGKNHLAACLARMTRPEQGVLQCVTLTCDRSQEVAMTDDKLDTSDPNEKHSVSERSKRFIRCIGLLGQKSEQQWLILIVASGTPANATLSATGSQVPKHLGCVVRWYLSENTKLSPKDGNDQPFSRFPRCSTNSTISNVHTS